MQQLDSMERRRHTENHLRLAEIVFHLFRSKDKSILPWTDIYESLRSVDQFTSEKEYRDRLVQVQKIIPEWITLVTLPKGTQVKLVKK